MGRDREKSKSKVVFIIFLIIIVTIVLFMYFRFTIKKETNILSNNVEEQVMKLLDLSTVKYNYTNVVAYKDNKKLKNMDIPFTSKGFLIKYSGYIKAGIDLSTASVKVVDKDNAEIIFDKPIILDNVINEDDAYIYDEKESLFNQLKIQDLYDVLIKEKENMEKEAIEKGILNEAEENALEILNSFLTSMGFTDINISFRE